MGAMLPGHTHGSCLQPRGDLWLGAPSGKGGRATSSAQFLFLFLFSVLLHKLCVLSIVSVHGFIKNSSQPQNDEHATHKKAASHVTQTDLRAYWNCEVSGLLLTYNPRPGGTVMKCFFTVLSSCLCDPVISQGNDWGNAHGDEGSPTSQMPAQAPGQVAARWPQDAVGTRGCWRDACAQPTPLLRTRSWRALQRSSRVTLSQSVVSSSFV